MRGICLCAQWEVASNKPRVENSEIALGPCARERAANSAADLIRPRYIKGNKALSRSRVAARISISPRLLCNLIYNLSAVAPLPYSAVCMCVIGRFIDNKNESSDENFILRLP